MSIKRQAGDLGCWDGSPGDATEPCCGSQGVIRGRVLRLPVLQDWHGRTVRLVLQVRKDGAHADVLSSFLDVPDCPRRKVYTRHGLFYLTLAEFELGLGNFFRLPLYLDDSSQCVYLRGELAPKLAGIQYELLRALCRRQGVLHREVLYKSVWASRNATLDAVRKAVERLSETLSDGLGPENVALSIEKQLVILRKPDQFAAVFDE